LAAVAGALAAASFAAANRPAALPFTITLPSGWHATATTPGSRYDAVSSEGTAHLDVGSAKFPAPLTFGNLLPLERTQARQHYRSEDPRASVTTKTVTLKSGPAAETTVFLQHGGPLAIYVFAILHNGVVYHLTFYTSQSLAGAKRAAFLQAANSVAFKG
jgi:hypothetical protein